MHISVTDIIKELSNPVDWEKKAKEKAKKENVSIESIKDEWEKKRETGILVHEKIINKEMASDGGIYEGYNSGKFASDHDKVVCKLENNNIYYEKFISSVYGICGFADKIVISKNKINVYDLKVKDVLYFSSSFKLDNGFKVDAKKMLEPLSHLDDCNGIHATLQLSLYMYLVWENNKNLKPGKLYIRHIKVTDKGRISKDELIEVPYLRKEVKEMIKYWKLNA